MKAIKKSTIFLATILFTISCDNKDDEMTGICATVDGQICKKGFTRTQCDLYIKNKELGKDWVFYPGSGSICPPITP